MDLDLAQVRAFVAIARLLHFGQAAEELGISQQALSKRIARLEQRLAVRLFERGGGAVRLTGAGRRFLDPAGKALASGDQAVAAVLGDPAPRPLRVDVWGHLYGPMRTLAAVVEADAHPVETGSGRDFPSVAAALRRGDIDAGFGRVPSLPGRSTDGLTHRLVRLEPVDAVVGENHPLSGAAELRPEELTGSVLSFPAAMERLDFLTRFADRFGITRREEGPNLGLVPFLGRLRGTPDSFSLLPADSGESLDGIGVRRIPLVSPTPLYAWSFLWSATQQPPLLTALLRACARMAEGRRWLEYDPGRGWLP